MEKLHTIGDGSSYDADMSLIESFVRSFNRGDEISRLSVFSYYYSQLLNYWSYFKENLGKNINETINDRELGGIKKSLYFNGTFNDESGTRRNNRKRKYGEKYTTFEDDFLKNREKFIQNGLYSEEDIYQYYFPLEEKEKNYIEPYETEFMEDLMNIEDIYPRLPVDFIVKSHAVIDNKRFILQNIVFYESRFLELLNITKNNFEMNGNFRMGEIAYIYKYIATLMCYDPRVESLSLTSIVNNYYLDNHYILPNNTGLFGFNTYLYALFNNILLIGVPNKTVNFDATIGCPLKFMDHDYFHSNQISKYMKVAKIIPLIYYNILQQEYPKKLKELLILVIWILIHEEMQGINFEKYLQTNNPDILHNIYTGISQSNLPYIEEFTDEFLSFGQIINSPDSINLILKIFPQAGDRRYNYLLILLYGMSFIITYLK